MLRKESIETPAAAVENPPAAPTVSPEAIVEQLRGVGAQIGEVTPLTAAQRAALRKRADVSPTVVQASIHVIEALGTVSTAVGLPAAEVREMIADESRWSAVEAQLRGMLNGVAGANLIRRERIALVTGQAYTIGAQLARDPANAVLVPHVEEVKRLKRFTRRKKAAPMPQTPTTPAPAPGTTPPGGETSDPKKP